MSAALSGLLATLTPMTTPESFESFRLSFSYGSRTDLNFKFLKSLSDEDAAQFLETLLDLLGDAYDTGDVMPLIEAAYEAQVAGYAPSPSGPPAKFVYEDGPFTPLSVPVTDATLGMLTTSGHFVDGDDPEPFGEPDLTQQEAVARIDEFMSSTPALSEIPTDTPTDRLRVRHAGYDIRSAILDANVTFPIDRLREFEADGRIGELTPTLYSFPGATAHGRLRKVLPEWIERMRAQAMDVLLLVPI